MQHGIGKEASMPLLWRNERFIQRHIMYGHTQRHHLLFNHSMQERKRKATPMTTDDATDAYAAFEPEYDA